ncbi:MAG: hypothetical protein K1Y02_14030 [Candidatus Hydrogenedentes bacterium]|nr:hypothetical protein [Candidatus Hydrogenedentota bacterium]
MKSAYELAMERMERESGPTRKLNDDQKAAIAEIDKKYDAKIAEQRLSSESRMQSATTGLELEQIKADVAKEIASLEERREREKESVWNAG